MKKIMLITVFYIISCNFNTSLAQYAGDIDTDFGVDGFVLTPLGTSNNAAYTLLILPDGKILVAGSVDTPGSYGLARYDTDGTLDNTFSSDGKLITIFNGLNTACVNSLARFSSGKFIAAGQGDNGVGHSGTLAQYNSDGSLDISFSDDGILIFGIGNSCSGEAALIQNDEKIIIAGYTMGAYFANFFITRYNQNGIKDNTFGSSGTTVTDIRTMNDLAYALAMQSDGKLVVAGCSDTIGTQRDFAVVRYTADGIIDTSFLHDGKVTTAISIQDDCALSAAIQVDGKIVAAGYAVIDSTKWDAALVRYNTDGKLDSTFSSDGIVIKDIDHSQDRILSIAIQPDGKIVACGVSENDTTGYELLLMRFNSDGSLDTSFSTDGIVTLSFNDGQYYVENFMDLALQTDGKIVVVGTSGVGESDRDFLVTRFWGQPYEGIDVNGDNSEHLIQIFPNPFCDKLTIENKVDGNTCVDVFNMQGQLIKKFSFNKKLHTDWGDIKSGIYMLNVRTNETNMLKKIIKL